MSRVMSGMRATGAIHWGNYFGALKNWLHLQSQADLQCYFGIMDWHALTTGYKSSSEVTGKTREMYAEFLAWGIDTNRSLLYVQSLVPETLELFLILANLTPMGWLERVNTWKDAEEEAKQSDTHNLGRFSYPVLQAADILLFQGEKVPVGADQVSHLEITREIIRRFNRIYKAKLPEPKPLLTETPAVPGLDGRKMSKSYGNGVELTAESKVIQKQIRGMPTDPQRVKREDPGNPEKCTVYDYHKLFSSAEDLKWVEQGCRSAGIGCGDCKSRLIENVEACVAAPRERKKELLNKGNDLDSIILESTSKARKVAQATLVQVRKAMQW